MLVLSGVFNTRILVATNYANKDYMRVNYILIFVYTINLQPIKKRLMFLPRQSLCTAINWSNLDFGTN
jgi:hypothetical protein